MVASLPNSRRSAGRIVVPNLSDWMAGDVVVVQGKWLPSAVQLASLSRANRDGHKHTHAGIYVGQGVLIDAMPRGGIARRSLAAYVNRPVGLRRIPDISDQERARIADAAASYIGQSYNWWAAIASKLVPAEINLGRRAFYCSTLVAEAVELGCGKQLDALPTYRPLYPAALAKHQAFDAVEVEWRPRGRRAVTSRLHLLHLRPRCLHTCRPTSGFRLAAAGQVCPANDR